METEDQYLIWSHEHGAWWGPYGYVQSVSKAGRYSRDAALKICQNAIPGTSRRLGALPELPVRAADIESLRRVFLTLYNKQASLEDWL